MPQPRPNAFATADTDILSMATTSKLINYSSTLQLLLKELMHSEPAQCLLEISIAETVLSPMLVT